MARYRVEFTPAARREFLALPRQARERIAPHVEALAENSRPLGVKALAGAAHAL